ncbi:MAG: type II secretion system F family protein [Thermoguttaceae bacterium]
MPLDPLQTVAFLGPILFGIALAVALRLLPRISRWEAPDLLREALGLLSWILIAVGLVDAIMPLGGGPSGVVLPIPLLTFAAIVLLTSFQRWRLANQYGLLWAMATAAERGIPLIPAIDAFAEDRRQFGGRARRLAALLRAGWALPDALMQVRGPLPREDLLMIRVGQETGALARALRQTVSAAESRQMLWGETAGKLAYVLALPVFAMGILIFIMIKIVPAYIKIFQDFGADLPPVTVVMITVSNAVVNYWYLGMPIYFLFWCLLGYAALRYIGLIDTDLPGMGWLMRRYHVAAILDALALTTEQDRPIRETIAILARGYPRWWIRGKLFRVWQDVDRGEDWCASLHRSHLIGQAEYGVLQAAQRVGNLPWALREMAASTRRRLVYRLQAWLQILFPLVILVYGAVVAVIVVGLFMPLIALIQRLS